MPAEGFSRVLIANRGEVAQRIARAAEVAGLETVVVHSTDDADAPHAGSGDRSAALSQAGPEAYLDIAELLDAALGSGADAVHPGYGFLSESAEFARECGKRGLTFIGPAADVLDLFGDKSAAREVAAELGIPIPEGTAAPVSAEQLREFVAESPAGAVLKAASGGGGRGMRVLCSGDEVDAAFAACRAEAQAAFGSAQLYAERLVPDAQHIEVQVLGDGTHAVHLWDRDCSVQRRHQKLLETAPADHLPEQLREAMFDAATRLARHVGLRGVATVEFLVSGEGFVFCEVNPRLQVEHTVTEEILGIDLVRLQLALAGGASLDELGCAEGPPRPRGAALQVRVNGETPLPGGGATVHTGTLTGLRMPSGRGVRVESGVRAGQRTNPRFDSLLAKIVVHDPAGFDAAVRSARRALAEAAVTGVGTNLALQRAILDSSTFRQRQCRTDFVDAELAQLLAAAEEYAAAEELTPAEGAGSAAEAVAHEEVPNAVTAPLSGSVAALAVQPGDHVRPGQELVALEAMKMRHGVPADRAGVVSELRCAAGDVVDVGRPLLVLEPTEERAAEEVVDSEPDPEHVRGDLSRVLDRRALRFDAARPQAVDNRHARGMRTARENVAALVDPGTFREHGGFAVAMQRSRRDAEDLAVNTPADGMVTGFGSVNGTWFDAGASTCAVLAYDYTVLAGTQGFANHRKTDRVLDLARRRDTPVVLFAEGGGGRPGDVDAPGVAGLDVKSFSALGELSGRVPTVGIAAGRCFAGNAALLGTCDVVIATRDASIGMSGPAMVEGAGLGTFSPEEIGPIGVQTRNGVVDIAVEDEAEATEAARRYLAYFQGELAGFTEPDQRRLRHVVPEDRTRAYDVRAAVELLCDTGSVLPLRPGYGTCVVTALARIGGRPVGVLANNPAVAGGAIDGDGADKVARLMQLCEVFGLPIVSLCDTPGFMVGPRSEEDATVRRFGRLFVRGARLTVPVVTVVLRKSYGLGAMAMAGGSLANPAATVSWPSGEFGGMGLEGAVRLGYRRELEAIADPDARQRRYEQLVAELYELGGALNTATHLEIDEVIDPAETRSWVLSALPAVPRTGWVNPHARVAVDPW
ncbi:acetyl-CoA carboxylase family protein [Bounagaea algeriensis]